MDPAKTKAFISSKFSESIVHTLEEYIRIPNLSPAYDDKGTNPEETEKVISLFSRWVEQQDVQGLTLEIIRLKDESGKDRTPLMFMEVKATKPAAEEMRGKEDTILLYGHLDKQPPFEGWHEGLHPYIPVIKEGRLYGRGGADDGYSIFGAISAIKACQEQGVPHPRCVILIESCEESGSPDLPYYVKDLIKEGRMQDVSLVICLDSGALSYDSMYITTSLRGVLITDLTVQTLTEGVHSGDGSGVCSDSFRVCRKLLDELEDASNGKVHPAFHVDIPGHRQQETRDLVKHFGQKDGGKAKALWDHFPLARGVPLLSSEDAYELQMNRTWRPFLTITGQEGLPSYKTGGNVLRPATKLKLSLRLPPTFDHTTAAPKLKEILEKAAPPDAKVEACTDGGHCGPGWDAPKLHSWLQASLDKNGELFYGCKPQSMGEGGSIPFMGMLGDMFPKAQFVVTGVLGPHSNAHGPNEFLDLEYCQKLICVIAHTLPDHLTRTEEGGEEGEARGMGTALDRVGGAAEDKLVAEKKQQG